MNTNDFKSWNQDKNDIISKSNNRTLLPLKTLIELNFIGQTYHSNFGYNNEELIYYADEVFNILTFPYVNLDVENYPEIYAEVNIGVVQDLSQHKIVPHKTVTLIGYIYEHNNLLENVQKLRDNITNNAVFWYDLSPGIKHPNTGFTTDLNPVSARSYIRINVPFNEILLDSTLKGTALTLDDIFFASRALMIDQSRSSSYYNVVSDDGENLVLYVDIDNT